MIIFLTLCYVAALALAIKFGLIKLTLFWKLSPLLWMLLLFLVLFLPMQWGAPGGPVNVFQYVVEIIPNVSGEVIEVPVKPLKPLKRGEILFKIDPTPFQARVDALEAQLEQALQNVDRLEATADAADLEVKKTQESIEVQKNTITASAASVEAARAGVGQAEALQAKMELAVQELRLQVSAAGRELDRQKSLLARSAGSEADVDRADVRLSQLKNQLNAAMADLDSAKDGLDGSRATLDEELADEKAALSELSQLTNAELPRALSLAREARLAAESMIDGEHTLVANVRAQLAEAQFNLDETVVRAPSEGYAVAVTLREGQRVANFPVRSWMAFVDQAETEVVVAINQYALRYVEPGQKAEVTFKLRPGQIVEATVDRIAYVTASGQLQPSGQIVSTSTASNEIAEPYGVVLKIDDPTVDVTLAGGARGTAAIYTESMKATHIIRRVMLRMDAWMNYVIP